MDIWNQLTLQKRWEEKLKFEKKGVKSIIILVIWQQSFYQHQTIPFSRILWYYFFIFLIGKIIFLVFVPKLHLHKVNVVWIMAMNGAMLDVMVVVGCIKYLIINIMCWLQFFTSRIYCTWYVVQNNDISFTIVLHKCINLIYIFNPYILVQ